MWNRKKILGFFFYMRFFFSFYSGLIYLCMEKKIMKWKFEGWIGSWKLWGCYIKYIVKFNLRVGIIFCLGMFIGIWWRIVNRFKVLYLIVNKFLLDMRIIMILIICYKMLFFFVKFVFVMRE